MDQCRAPAGEDAMALIACGAERRRSAATAANADSSRSHAVLACQARPTAAWRARSTSRPAPERRGGACAARRLQIRAQAEGCTI